MFDRNEYQKNYRKEKLKRISLEVPKEYYEQIKIHAESMNESVNGFIKRAIKEGMKNDKK